MKTQQKIYFHRYVHADDYQRVSEFLISYHQSGNLDGNWIEPAWEYMHYHPALDSASLGKIGIWEEAGEIVAVTHYEWRLGEAFFQFHPGYRYLRAEMLDYAEANLVGVSRKDGRKYLCAYVNDNDPQFLELVQARGYEKDPDGARPFYRFDIPNPFPAIHLPEGFRLTSLAEECDWAKVNRILWRGFDHDGEPPMSAEDIESRRRMFDTPKARYDLKIAVAAPNGDFAAFCGMFYEPTGCFGYVEPVAADPAYRRLGLGKAAVLEGIRRCGALGAPVAYVGSDQEFYQAIGFKKVYNSECWVKTSEIPLDGLGRR
jgi:GNAT superfamily N-acetyltransferase